MFYFHKNVPFKKCPIFTGPDLKRARCTGLSAQRARRTKLRGPKGLQLEVGARRAPRLLVAAYFCSHNSAAVIKKGCPACVSPMQHTLQERTWSKKLGIRSRYWPDPVYNRGLQQGPVYNRSEGSGLQQAGTHWSSLNSQLRHSRLSCKIFMWFIKPAGDIHIEPHYT